MIYPNLSQVRWLIRLKSGVKYPRLLCSGSKGRKVVLYLLKHFSAEPESMVKGVALPEGEDLGLIPMASGNRLRSVK